MITLEVSQEVSNPGAAAAGGNPPIAQRTIDSTVVVQSGQTVMLGGLIRENRSNTKSGIPGLMNIPLLGVMFSNNTKDVSRTELIVTLTPRVIESPMEARQATDDLRRRVRAATAVETSVRH
jgi:general secretion pathway protein D